jgi:probable HAF family extracellular repeat protein
MNIRTTVAGLLLGVLLGPAAAQTISITGLEAIPSLGGTNTDARAINGSGQVVGWSQTAGGNYHAFVYSSGSSTDLGTLGGSGSFAHGINDSGQVAGYSDLNPFAAHAFRHSSGTMSDLGTLGGTNSYGFAINSSGAVAGSAQTAGGQWHAFVYQSSTMTDLGTLGGASSNAQAINSSGQVVGSAQHSGNATYEAFIYSGGTMTGLGTLTGDLSIANGINSSGQVVGWAGLLSTGGGIKRAFLYSGGTMFNLGGLTGSGDSEATAINSSGLIVGFAVAPGPSVVSGGTGLHAFLYAAGTMHDLNTLAGATWLSDGTTPGFVELSRAYGINDVGQIAGNGVYWTGTAFETRGFLLNTSAIPEPSTYAALAGLAALGLVAWQRSKKRLLQIS